MIQSLFELAETHQLRPFKDFKGGRMLWQIYITIGGGASIQSEPQTEQERRKWSKSERESSSLEKMTIVFENHLHLSLAQNLEELHPRVQTNGLEFWDFSTNEGLVDWHLQWTIQK